MKTRIHVNLSVNDIERSVQFYSLLFGAQPSKVRDDYANFRLDEPGLHLALVKSPEHAGGDAKARHFGVELFENDVIMHDASPDDVRACCEVLGLQKELDESRNSA